VYSAAFLDHFQRPRGLGELAAATHRGVADDGACGDRLWLDLRVEAGRVAAAAFRVEGCAGAIAAGSALVTLLPGRVAAADAVVREEIEAVLGGVPGAKRHALGLARRALRAALDAPLDPSGSFPP
jgi:nitrogen fixation NifU-like protein